MNTASIGYDLHALAHATAGQWITGLAVVAAVVLILIAASVTGQGRPPARRYHRHWHWH